MLEKLKDRKKTIDAIFFLVSSVAKLTDVDVEAKAFLMQAATAARYDCEIYRGTFKLPVDVFEYLVFQVPKGERQQFIKEGRYIKKFNCWKNNFRKEYGQGYFFEHPRSN